MTFVVRMAARELRASWRRLLFFFVCVAVGVGAIVALRSIIQSARLGLTHESRALIASDVIVQTNRAWDTAGRARLDAALGDPRILGHLESVETPTMVRPETGDAARMVELRAVQDGFPFYGTIELDGGQPFSHALLRDRGALVRPELLAQIGVRVGDRIMIGGAPFTIRGLLLQEPGRRPGAFSLGPRVLVDYGDLVATNLLTFGSRANYQVLLKVRPDAVEAVTGTLRAGLREQFASVRSYRSTEDQIGENLGRAEDYLSLVGFVIVVLGGIGVWSVTRVFVKQKIRSVAILKCVGATGRQVLAVYVLQVVLLALAGSVLGVGLARLGIAAVPDSLTASFGNVRYGVTWSAALQGLAVGLLVSLLFALVPLLDIRRVKPLLLIRGLDAVPDQRPARPSSIGLVARLVAAVRGWDWGRIAVTAAVAAALVVVAAWQAGSLTVGLVVTLGFVGTALVLHGAGALLVRGVAPLAATRVFPLRHAVIGLRRPGNQTRVILLAVGLGSFFVLGVRALQSNLLQEFSVAFQRGGADMFLIDIQQDQAPGVKAFLDARASSPVLIPVLRARVTGVRGRDPNRPGADDGRGPGGLGREFVVTFRDHLEANETIVDGTFWTGQPPLPDNAPELEVSIERGVHERSRINVGDHMRFDILGRTLDAKVTSIREVAWEDARAGGFIFVFRPGPLSRAPHTYIAVLQAPGAADARARFQRDLVAGFPNVTAIDMQEVMATVARVVDNVTLAITVVGGIALVSGVFILIGAVAMTKFQRIYESAILRTLGASTRLLASTVAIEYLTLGLLAGLVGAAGAFVLNWAVCRYVFDIGWRPSAGLLLTGAALTALLVGAVGLIASLDVLRTKPLATLRAE